jgi:hypothetical protein
MSIYYTGIGCHNDFYHTEDEFLLIMYSLLYQEDSVFNRDVDYENFTLEQWLEESGAVMYEPVG